MNKQKKKKLEVINESISNFETIIPEDVICEENLTEIHYNFKDNIHEKSITKIEEPVYYAYTPDDLKKLYENCFNNHKFYNITNLKWTKFKNFETILCTTISHIDSVKSSKKFIDYAITKIDNKYTKDIKKEYFSTD